MVIKNILENNLNSKIKMVVIDGGPNAPQFTETVLRLLDEMTMRRS
jgi:hypothetical protein